MATNDATAASSASEPAATWDACVGPAKWLNEPLQRILGYPRPLPVQQAVIPTITRALMSGVPNDVSLTAPTGSGKTLCYLVPLLRLLTETKKGVDDNALRCLILVPTPSLGQQVHRELQRLTRPTSIRVACICADAASDGRNDEVASAEANLLIRRVALPRRPLAYAATTAALASLRRGSGARSLEEKEADEDASDAEGDLVNNSEDDGNDDDESNVDGDDETSTLHRDSSATRLRPRNAVSARYFSNADVIVAMPQRLLHHLDHTRGFRLADLRLLVIDEADQVLVGNFASQVQKVNARYEYEVHRQQQAQQRRQQRTSEALAARMAADHAVPASSSSSLRRFHGGSTTTTARVSADVPMLHKMLCSATLSSRIARISQVKLRNCSYYVLDSNGEERKEEAAVSTPITTTTSSAAPLQKHGGGDHAAAATASGMMICTQFALPPTLQEHILFVEDSYRPAVLLKLVHTLRERIAAAQKQRRAAAEESRNAEENRDGAVQRSADAAAAAATSSSATSMDYPCVEDKAGTGILIFCAAAEEARVMSHFLAAAGITSIVEFTTLASEAERRRALLLQRSTAGATADDVADVSCVVASDALMRGIDIPNVGHVIMYHPPDAVSQYVHRAGRTARAMRPGHVHLLLSKTGPSGSQEDGEMALYKRLSQSLSRTLPVSYERLFFRFAENPARRTPVASSAQHTAATATTTTTTTPAATNSGTTTVPAAGSAEWWVKQAEKFLVQSQHQLQRRWASVLESAAAVAAATAKRTAASAVSTTSGGGSGGQAPRKKPRVDKANAPVKQ
ncbi:ATP-dependent RNA helicase [Lotmaria passim]